MRICHSKAAGEIDGECMGLTTVTEVDLNNQTCFDIYSRLTPAHNGVIDLFDNRYILYENMEWVDIETKEVVGKIDYPYDRMKYGYFVTSHFKRVKDYLFFIYSERIVMYDYKQQKVYREYPEEYCSCADIIGDKVVIGTWKKVMIDDL